VAPIQADQKFDEIFRAYAGPDRFYHTLDHVLAVLARWRA
jgi:predicted metal-dependent HD superfamily phosphohydrolase